MITARCQTASSNATVTCTSYQGDGLPNGVLTPVGTAPDNQIIHAAVGTVDHGAVTTNHGLHNPGSGSRCDR
jgi:hypothetical protein